MKISNKAQAQLDRWHTLAAYIDEATADAEWDSSPETVRYRRSSFPRFVQAYFPHYATAETADFQAAAADAILTDPDVMAAIEWPRDHAKSVTCSLMLPLYLLAHGQVAGMVLINKSNDGATRLLGDLAAELAGNNRFIADYGELLPGSTYKEGEFVTTSGIRFMALGRGQSPRGIRSRMERPNLVIIDDLDDDELVRNPTRVAKVMEWIFAAVYPAIAIPGRMVMVGNRIHPAGCLAHYVGDVKEGDLKREGLYHNKVAALLPDGTPAWPQRFTTEELQRKFDRMGYRLAQQEYFHNPIIAGSHFDREWIRYKPALDFGQYDHLVVYIDPAFSNSRTADFKAVRLMGSIGGELHHLAAYVRRRSIAELVRWCYDLYDRLGGAICEWYIEGGFMQGMLLEDFGREGTARGYQLPLRKDKRTKPAKAARIESMTPLYERGLVYYADALRTDPDSLRAIEQLLAFAPGSSAHDDGPDAEEGAIYKLQQRARQRRTTRRIAPPRRARLW